MVSQKDVMNDAYTAAAITAGAVGVSYASKKFLKMPLGVPETVNGAAKLAVAVGLGCWSRRYKRRSISRKKSLKNKWQV